MAISEKVMDQITVPVTVEVEVGEIHLHQDGGGSLISEALVVVANWVAAQSKSKTQVLPIRASVPKGNGTRIKIVVSEDDL